MGSASKWRGGRVGEAPGADALWDSGRVPLSPRENAKGGEQGTQLASLKQVSPALQRIFPRAKRKPAPVIQAVRSRSLTDAVHWHEWSVPRR